MRLQEVVRKLLEIEGENLESVILFGSRARGDYTEDSDVDLVIIVRRSRERFIDRPLKYVYMLNIPADILVYTVEEFEKMYRDRVCLALDVLSDGVPLFDRGFFSNLKRVFEEEVRSGRLRRTSLGWVYS